VPALFNGSNVELERSTALIREATLAYNRFALAAQSDQMSWPLQALEDIVTT